MALATEIRKTVGEPIFLLETTAGKTAKFWSQTSGDLFWTTFETKKVVSSNFNGVVLTPVLSVGALVAYSWYWDFTSKTLYVQLDGEDPGAEEETVTYLVVFYFATDAKYLNGHFWEPLLTAVPNLNVRVEEDFTGVTQVGGGDCSFVNNSGFFNLLTGYDYDWDAGTTKISLGFDRPQNNVFMPFSDYLAIGVWRNVQLKKDDTNFILSLSELKDRINRSLPFEFYTREAYPEIKDGDIGKPIQIAYGQIFGASPIVLSTSVPLSILTNGGFEQGTVIPTDWRFAAFTGGSGTIVTDEFIEGVQSFRFHHPGGDTPNGGGTLTSGTNPNSFFPVVPNKLLTVLWKLKASQDASLGVKVDIVWFDDDYLNVGVSSLLDTSSPPLVWTSYEETILPPAGAIFAQIRLTGGVQGIDPGSGGAYIWFDDISITEPAQKRMKIAGHRIFSIDAVRMARNNGWLDITMTSTDLANGEFTTDEWDGESSVAVDLHGKATLDLDGNPVFMSNAADIMLDLLQGYLGETDFETFLFDESRTKLFLGTNNLGRKIDSRTPSIYLDADTNVLDVLELINKTVGSYLYSGANGKWRYIVFEPKPGEGLQSFDQDVFIEPDFEELTPDAKEVSEMVVRYNPRVLENWAEFAFVSRPRNQYSKNERNPIPLKISANLSTRIEVLYFAQRNLIIKGKSRKFYTIKFNWLGFLLQPGDQIRLVYPRHSLDKVLEIMDANLDLITCEITILCSDLHAFRDNVGFWVNDTDVLPTRFSTLAGYGSRTDGKPNGSLFWYKAWDNRIKIWARQNVGYWTDPNGFADPTDPDSYIPSSWF